MKKYDKIWVPDDTGQHEVVHIPSETEVEGSVIGVRNAIVLSEEELLDLMQESIEYSYPTLLRERAKLLLTEKLKNNSLL